MGVQLTMISFIECESITVSYNAMGIATISYTLISDSDSINLQNAITVGGVTFKGWITEVYQQQIPKTEHSSTGSWYSTNVTMIAVS